MKVTDSVVKIFNESGQLYGSPKIAALINRSGEDKVSQKYVLGIMKKLGIKPKYIRHRTITTVSRNFSSELKNILHRHFNPEKPDAFWCTDITYIWTYDDGFVYLTSVMDLYSRKIVGWCVTRTMDANVVLECIEMAKRRRGIQKGHRRNGQEPFKEGNAMGQCVHRIMAFTSQEGVHKIP